MPWQLEEGWDIAPGDGDDLQVCRLHPWQSDYLAFADGHFAGTSAVEERPQLGIHKGRVLTSCITFGILHQLVTALDVVVVVTVLGEMPLEIHPTNSHLPNFISEFLSP